MGKKRIGRKYAAGLLAAVVVISMLAGCGPSGGAANTASADAAYEKAMDGGRMSM